MGGEYRQTFLRASADGEEMTQSASLKVETNKTLGVVVEGVRVSYHLGLDVNHVMHTTPSEVGQLSGGARKRKRETSLGQVQQPPFGSPAAQNISTLHEQHSGRPWKSRRNNPISSSNGGEYMSDLPPVASVATSTSEFEPGWFTALPQSLVARVKLDGTEPVAIAVDKIPISGYTVTFCWMAGLLATGPERRETFGVLEFEGEI
ncbi:hypothetical protein BGY98DRAFT_1181004 [Russula aff. rugulosa BPL654]|nr:hypothetical protein BGY98DRAFT_1181004 [Russula aff. rugulosa BPL654]